MQVAQVFAERSTCSRAHVGVVISRDGRILVTGYNGAPAGMPHCDHTCDCGSASRMDTQHAPSCPAGPCRNAVHAEANAIAYAAKHGVRIDGASLYTTFTPCLPCAQLVVNAGIVEVHAQQRYRDNAGLLLLTQAGVQVV
jgi:dCMP deaminase